MEKAREKRTGFLRKRQTMLQDPEILSAPRRFCLGKSTQIRIRQGNPEEQVQNFFRACLEDGTLARLRELCVDETGLVGLNSCFSNEEYRYTLAVFADEEASSPDDLERVTLDEGAFAAFALNGGSCHDAWREIYNNWLPRAPYRYRVAQEIEAYREHGPLHAETLWVPIQQREQPPLLESRRRTGRPGSGKFWSAALFAIIGMLFSPESGVPWLGALLGAAVGYLLFTLFQRIKNRTHDS